MIFLPLSRGKIAGVENKAADGGKQTGGRLSGDRLTNLNLTIIQSQEIAFPHKWKRPDSDGCPALQKLLTPRRRR
jgi:hypothetical protein